MVKLPLIGMFVVGLYVQVKFPHLFIHCAVINFATNVIWLLLQG